MTPRDRDLYDVGLAGPPRPYHFREDPSPWVRTERALRAEVLDPVAGAIVGFARFARRVFLAAFPTRADRLQAFVLLVAALYIGGYLVPHTFHIDAPHQRMVAGAGR